MSAVVLVVSALAPLMACAQIAGFRDIDIIDTPSVADASSSVDGAADTSVGPEGKPDGAADDTGAHDAACDPVPVAAGCGDAGVAGGGRVLVHVLSDINSTPDHQGVMAVAGGVPNTAMGPSTAVWNAEKLKPWHTLDNFISSTAGVDLVVSTCVPPGSYTLQFWDIWGSNGSFNNGTPPTVTYVWQIGNSSELVTVTAGVTTELTLRSTHSDNVPASGSFYGAWAQWEYGACTTCGTCPSNATCSGKKCIDLAFDVRNCGGAGSGCAGKTCCKSGCVDTTNDAKNCGGCGNACAPQHLCTTSQCQ